MSVFKLITVQGARPFKKRTLELVVYKDAVEKVLALLEKGRQLRTDKPDHDFVQHTFMIMQSTSFFDKAKAFEAMKYGSNTEWGTWYSLLLLHHYDLEDKSPGELKKIFDGIEVIEFSATEEVAV